MIMMYCVCVCVCARGRWECLWDHTCMHLRLLKRVSQRLKFDVFARVCLFV